MDFILYKVILFYLLISYCKGNNDNVCSDKKCISKCCPGQSYVENDQCVLDTSFSKDFSDLKVYNSKLVTTSNVKDSFHITEYKHVSELVNQSIPLLPFITFFIVEDGKLTMKLSPDNAFPKWEVLDNDNFCIDYLLDYDNTTVPWFWGKSTDKLLKNINFRITALIISSIFLLLVLIIYTILKELRNLKGKIVMAYVLSLLGAFISLATLQIITTRKDFVPLEEQCFQLTLPVYFFFLATFCWMNVMSFDIWWTLRSIRSQVRFRKLPGSNLTVYCIYAWGLPLVMTVAVYFIDNADLSDRPWIIKPNIVQGGCFFTDNEKLVYFYAPMLILIVSNWIFYLMTAFNYWMFGRETNIIDSRSSNTNRKQKERFMVYIKLSLIMGISWILEIISVVEPDFPLFYVTDAYNMFIGLAMFLIFVCKKKIFVKLHKRFRQNDKQEYNLDTTKLSTTT